MYTFARAEGWLNALMYEYRVMSISWSIAVDENGKRFVHSINVCSLFGRSFHDNVSGICNKSDLHLADANQLLLAMSVGNESDSYCYQDTGVFVIETGERDDTAVNNLCDMASRRFLS